MSLFGPPKPATTGFSFGQAAPTTGTTPAPSFGGGLFGNASQNTNTANPAPATGSLFGNTQTQPQQQQQQQTGGGLFGQPAAQQGGLFGLGQSSSGQQQQQMQQPQQSSGGLFGNTSTTGTFSGFGTNKPTSSFGFGNQSTTAAPSFGLGQSTQQQQQQPQSQQSQFQQQQQMQQQQQQQLPPWSSGSGIQLESVFQVDIPADMLFEDIEKKFPDTAKAILMIEEALQRERKVKESIDVKELGHNLTRDRTDINVLSSGMQVHQHAIKDLRQRVDRLNQQAEEINNVWQTCVEVLKTAHEGKASGGSMIPQHGAFYRDFFKKLAEQMKVQMDQYRRTVEQIERQLVGLGKASNIPTPQAVAQTVSNNQNTIMGLASDMSGLEERIRILSDEYRQVYRSKMNTVVDPFVIARAEAGEPPLGYSGKRGERGLNDDLGGLKMG